MNSKVFIQYVWVSLTILVTLFTMVFVCSSSTEKISLWIQALPLVQGVIVALGGAASIGPLIKKKLEQDQGRKNECEK